MENLKLIAIDLGGTLLSDDNQISDLNKNAISQAKSQGIKIAIASARMYSSTKYISHVIKCDYGVFSNGSHLFDITNQKTLKGSLLLNKAVLELIDFARKKDIYIHLNQELCEVSESLKFFSLKHTLLNQKYPPNLKSNILITDDLKEYVISHPEIMKLALVSEFSLDSILSELNTLLSKYNLFITEYYRNVYENAINKMINYIEIGSSPDNKAKGIKKLVEILGISSSEVLVIGDGNNDLEMLASFPKSACMNNGSQEAKKLARYITKRTNNESGVAEAINHFIR